MTPPGALAVPHDRVRHVDGAFKGWEATVIEVITDPLVLCATPPKAVKNGCTAGYHIRFDKEQIWTEAHPPVRHHATRTWFVPAEQWRKVEPDAGPRTATERPGANKPRTTGGE